MKKKSYVNLYVYLFFLAGQNFILPEDTKTNTTAASSPTKEDEAKNKDSQTAQDTTSHTTSPDTKEADTKKDNVNKENKTPDTNDSKKDNKNSDPNDKEKKDTTSTTIIKNDSSSTAPSTNSSETASKSSNTTASTPSIPAQKKPQLKILTSIYIQNNYKEDAMLKQIEILLAGKSEPLQKKLNVSIAANHNVYSKGTITAFDLTTENNVEEFNGIVSISIDNDQIKFSTPRTGFSLSHPITIIKKDSHWVFDEQ